MVSLIQKFDMLYDVGRNYQVTVVFSLLFIVNSCHAGPHQVFN